MNRHNNLPSSSEAFGGLTGFSCRNDKTLYPLYFQGMSVQTLNSPRSVYFSQSDANQNNTHPVIPLDEFHATSLTQTVSKSFVESDLTVIPTTILDEYVPWNSANACIAGELPSSSSCCLCNQSCFSGNGPDIREPIPANQINLDNHLTNFLTEQANPEDSRPGAVVNPLNLQQATSDNRVNSAKSVADKSSQAERQRQRRQEREREYRRRDPAYAERKRERRRELEREHCQNDPTYAERKRERRRELEREHRRNDPTYAERKKERRRELEREHCRNDPTYAERRRKRKCKLQRERYRNDPDYAQRERERKKRVEKKRRENLAYAEHQR